jgi:hypothetical protein
MGRSLTVSGGPERSGAESFLLRAGVIGLMHV